MSNIKIIERNKRASYDYYLLEVYEAGIALQGTEVKSLRDNKVKMSEAFVSIDKGKEAWIYNLSIPEFKFGNINNHRPDQRRKLLLHKKEIDEIFHRAKAEGLTIIATKIYFKNGRVKLEIALAKGKKLYDKRQDQAKKDAKRKLQKKEFQD